MNENFAIQLFEGKKVRIVWDAEQEKYYFSVTDIVQVLTDSVNPRDYIKKMLRRDPELKSKWGTICPPVEMLAPDGKRHKGLTKENLRDNMTNVELALNTLAEVATTEIARQRQTQGMSESRQAAQAGGQIAKNTRDDLERQLGRTVISSERASDYIKPIESKDAKIRPLPEKE